MWLMYGMVFVSSITVIGALISVYDSHCKTKEIIKYIKQIEGKVIAESCIEY